MKPNIWVSSSQAKELLAKQRVTWPLAKDNYEAFTQVKIKTFDLGGFNVKVQFNPSRIVSSGAKLDPKSIRERKCFLCANNLPVEQERLPFGYQYLILCNPYPLLPEHFTVPTRAHVDQSILNRFVDFLELARRLNEFTVFYNGPRSGASAPDHAHFQAGTRGYIPMDTEIDDRLAENGELLLEEASGKLYLLTRYLRNGFVIKTTDILTANRFFDKIYHALDTKEGETEPMMNVFSIYKDGEWTVIVIPRKKHRPRQYDAEGEDQLTTSPGAADIGGLFITPLEKDFNKMSVELLQDVYEQVCFNDSEIRTFSERIV